jgi:dTMP kinase
MDKETSEFYVRVREAYLKIAANEPERFRVIDAVGFTDEVQMRVVKTVTEFLGKS